MITTIRYGANFQIVGKTDPQSLSYSGAFRCVSGTLQDLADHIKQGHPWMPAQLNGNGKRWQSNANYAELAATDIDGGMTIAQALEHPFIRQHLALGVESASSKPDHHKFRLVFRYASPVVGWELIRLCNKYLIHLIGVADPSCKDASRFFFGAPGRVPFMLNESATLPESFVSDAQAWR
jgi:hypothetical protein